MPLSTKIAFPKIREPTLGFVNTKLFESWVTPCNNIWLGKTWIFGTTSH